MDHGVELSGGWVENIYGVHDETGGGLDYIRLGRRTRQDRRDPRTSELSERGRNMRKKCDKIYSQDETQSKEEKKKGQKKKRRKETEGW